MTFNDNSFHKINMRFSQFTIFFSLIVSVSTSAQEFYCSDYSGKQRFKVHSVTGIIQALSPNNTFDNSKADQVIVKPSTDAFSIKSTYGGEVRTINIHSSGMGDGIYLYNYHGYELGEPNSYGRCTMSKS